MASEKKSGQGFVVVATDCHNREWAYLYLSKFAGEKDVKYCRPSLQEILGTIADLFRSCWRVELLTEAFTVGHERETMVRDIGSRFPEVKIVYMTRP